MPEPTPGSLTPAEVAFLCEMELVTVIPRSRLTPLKLLSGRTPSLTPPHRVAIPLWLALLLKRQRRADIAPPRWLHPVSLAAILDRESDPRNAATFSKAPPLTSDALTPPFQSTSTSDYLPSLQSPEYLPDHDLSPDCLPYHWHELSQLLLATASDDITDPERVRRLLRDIREVRLAKLRSVVKTLAPGAGMTMNGLGAMELTEGRPFLSAVIDALTRLAAARDRTVKDRFDEEGGVIEDDDDEDML